MVDVALVDEGHLLWTQGNQAYQGENQLIDIRKRSKVTILMYDENQILSRQGFSTSHDFENLKKQAKSEGNFIRLSKQMRMKASPEILEWIADFIYQGKIDSIPEDANYSLKVFTDPNKMDERIREDNENFKSGNSRIVSTDDWKCLFNEAPKNSKNWQVSFPFKGGNFSKPWNFQLVQEERKKSWTEIPETINEVGSSFTTQGSDLEYVGVILGPSVVFRDGKVKMNPSASKNIYITYKRDGKDVSVQLLKNNLNVLMTRGIRGLYLYAVDDELEKELLKMQQKNE